MSPHESIKIINQVEYIREKKNKTTTIQGVSQKSVINLTVVRGCLGKYFGIGNIGSQQLIKG